MFARLWLTSESYSNAKNYLLIGWLRQGVEVVQKREKRSGDEFRDVISHVKMRRIDINENQGSVVYPMLKVDKVLGEFSSRTIGCLFETRHQISTWVGIWKLSNTIRIFLLFFFFFSYFSQILITDDKPTSGSLRLFLCYHNKTQILYFANKYFTSYLFPLVYNNNTVNLERRTYVGLSWGWLDR